MEVGIRGAVKIYFLERSSIPRFGVPRASKKSYLKLYHFSPKI